MTHLACMLMPPPSISFAEETFRPDHPLSPNRDGMPTPLTLEREGSSLVEVVKLKLLWPTLVFGSSVRGEGWGEVAVVTWPRTANPKGLSRNARPKVGPPFHPHIHARRRWCRAAGFMVIERKVRKIFRRR